MNGIERQNLSLTACDVQAAETENHPARNFQLSHEGTSMPAPCTGFEDMLLRLGSVAVIGKLLPLDVLLTCILTFPPKIW